MSRVAIDRTFIEFFAGIGLVHEGLTPGGWRCLYANDHDPDKQAFYQARWPTADYYHLADVRDTASILQRIDGRPLLATASFPCTDLSLAGAYQGFKGKESSTYFAFAEVLRQLGERRPKLVMLENVLGFLTSKAGRDFRQALRTLDELGYAIDAFVVDAQWFVPQSRPRLFVVGMNKDELSSSTLEDSPLRPPKLLRMLQSLGRSAVWRPLSLPTPPRRTLLLESCLDVDDTQEWWEEAQVARHQAMLSPLHRRRTGFLQATAKPWVATAFRRMRDGQQRLEVRLDGLAGCLRTPRGGSARQIIVAGSPGQLRMRWMTGREYARLQGAPDFPLVAGVTQQLFAFADAVCVPAIAWIDRHILTPLAQPSTTG